MRGLIVREPYASMIVKGLKVWEIRRRRTNIRGEIYIVSRGYVLGKVELVDVLGPFTVEDLLNYEEKHRVSYEDLESYAKGSKLYAWVFERAKEFERPLKVNVPKGAQIWVKLDKFEEQS